MDQHLPYLFPPPDLIRTCLQKLSNYKIRGLYIAPHLPSAPWWLDCHKRFTPCKTTSKFCNPCKAKTSGLKARRDVMGLSQPSISNTLTLMYDKRLNASVFQALSLANRPSTPSQYENCWKDINS